MTAAEVEVGAAGSRFAFGLLARAIEDPVASKLVFLRAEARTAPVE